MAVRTVKCDACLRDLPIDHVESARVEGNNLVVCKDSKECRKHWEKEETCSPGKTS